MQNKILFIIALIISMCVMPMNLSAKMSELSQGTPLMPVEWQAIRLQESIEGKIIRSLNPIIKESDYVIEVKIGLDLDNFEDPSSKKITKTKKEIDDTLKTRFSKNIRFKELEYEKIISFKSLLDLSSDDSLKNIFNQDFIYEPIENYFYTYRDLVKSISKNIGKNINEISFTNGQLQIVPGPYADFFNVLVHLFRNCVDHGIEFPTTRLDQGKTLEGNIDIEFNKIQLANKSMLQIIVKDNGAGIDPDKIKAKLISLKPDESFEHLTETELIYKIFDPFFSTKDEVSILSGRGVGMSAIKTVVDQLGGQIELQSRVGLGSSFIFTLPIL